MANCEKILEKIYPNSRKFNEILEKYGEKIDKFYINFAKNLLKFKNKKLEGFVEILRKFQKCPKNSQEIIKKFVVKFAEIFGKIYQDLK